MKNSQIIEIFNQFKNDPQMHTEFYHDGCIYRTKQLCDYILKNHEFDKERVYFAQLTPKERGKINCTTVHMKNGENNGISWGEHWVPIVYDENNEMIVLDICLMDGPEKLTDYMNNFENAEIKKDYICNARSADYNLLYIKTYNFRIDEMANNTNNEEYKIYPNTVHSNWIRENKTKNIINDKNIKYYLEVKEKLVQKALRDAGLAGTLGITGDSSTGNINSKHKRIASLQKDTLKHIMKEHRDKFH